MTDIVNLNAESGRNIISDDTTPTLSLENASASTGTALDLKVAATSAPTIAVMTMTNSTASGAFFEFKGFLASIASASSLQRGIRVKFGDSYGWIPVYVGGVFT